MTTWTAETWLRQRGTWPTTAKVLVRDLGMNLHAAGTQLARLARSGLALRVGAGLYIHRDTLVEHRMVFLVLFDANGNERHRADFPNRTRADIALRIVERDIRDRRPAVRVVGHGIHDPLYTISGVARAMIQPVPLPAGFEYTDATQHFDARVRAAGDDR